MKADFESITKEELRLYADKNKDYTQGGITDESNCVLICARCHSKNHGIVEI